LARNEIELMFCGDLAHLSFEVAMCGHHTHFLLLTYAQRFFRHEYVC
jgi:hypothetical protein